VNKNSYYRGFPEKRMVQELQAITANCDHVARIENSIFYLYPRFEEKG